jgi:FkbM family methyltransferase
LISIRSDGRRFLRVHERVVVKILQWIRRNSLVRVKLDDHGHPTRYLCENSLDATRPVSLWVKEEGTMKWIDAEVRPGDVFMDIGANIGIYTLAAAHRVGKTGAVYAFEPHKTNGVSLLRNIQANGFDDRVHFLSCALSDSSGMIPFNYRSLDAASTASQLGHTQIPGTSETFKPSAREFVYSATVDELLAAGTIRAPQLVKIDVDGNEIRILSGMRGLLISATRPRAVQVELNVGEHSQIEDLMRECGYLLAERHFTYSGKQAQDAGQPLAQIAHNAIFRPAAQV